MKFFRKISGLYFSWKNMGKYSFALFGLILNTQIQIKHNFDISTGEIGMKYYAADIDQGVSKILSVKLRNIWVSSGFMPRELRASGVVSARKGVITGKLTGLIFFKSRALEFTRSLTALIGYRTKRRAGQV